MIFIISNQILGTIYEIGVQDAKSTRTEIVL